MFEMQSVVTFLEFKCAIWSMCCCKLHKSLRCDVRHVTSTIESHTHTTHTRCNNSGDALQRALYHCITKIVFLYLC